MHFLWSGLIEVLNRGVKDTLQLLLLQEEQVIETQTPHSAQKAFTYRMSARRMKRRFQDLDAAGCGHARETGPKFIVLIANQVLGCVPIRGGFSQLLPDPRIGRRSGHAYVDDLA